MQTRIPGKVFFSIVTIAACWFSEVFWESLAYQILLPLVLFVVWFDWWIVDIFKSKNEKSPKSKTTSKKL